MEGGEGKASKSAKKNQKRRQKKHGDGDSTPGAASKPMSAIDYIPIIKEQLEEAKTSKDHKKAADLRKQLWVLTDMARGIKTDLPRDELEEIIKKLPTHTETKKAEETSSAGGASAPSGAPATSAEKRIKNLRKKLDQIQTLKEKQAQGATLEQNQIDKINSESTIQDEITTLEELMAGASI